MNEDELTRRLTNAANIAPSATSPFDMTMSTSPSGGSRPLWIAPALAGLLVAGGVGFVAGRNTSGFNSAAAPATTVAATTVPESTEAPTPAPSSDTTTTQPSDAAVPVDDVDVATGEIDAVDPIYNSSDPYLEPMNLVLERTVGAVRVRLSEGEEIDYGTPDGYEEQYDEQDDGWTYNGPEGVSFDPVEPSTPDWCNNDIEVPVRISVDSPQLVDIADLSVRPAATSDPTYQAAVLGYFDGAPSLVVAVFADDTDVVSVTATVDGASDTSDLTDGRAALVIPLSLDQAKPMMYETRAEVEATLADGSTVVVRNSFDLLIETCAPTLMPAPGDQPADPDAAFAAVSESFQRLMDTSIDEADKAELLDDWAGVSEALDQARTGEFADVIEDVEYSITDHVFTSPSEVWFAYTLQTPTGEIPDLYGVANLVDGSWQFRREMVCEPMSLGGGECSPEAGPIGPNYDF